MTRLAFMPYTPCTLHAGRSCPDFELGDGSRLGTLLREGRGVLLDFGQPASLQALDGLWGDQVRYLAIEAKDRLGLRALLVRPDGFVAWASDATPSPEEVTRAAARWFAGPSVRSKQLGGGERLG
jgi:hypothetical protein